MKNSLPIRSCCGAPAEGPRPTLGGRIRIACGPRFIQKPRTTAGRCPTSPMRPPGGRVGRGPGWSPGPWGTDGDGFILAVPTPDPLATRNVLNPERPAAMRLLSPAAVAPASVIGHDRLGAITGRRFCARWPTNSYRSPSVLLSWRSSWAGGSSGSTSGVEAGRPARVGARLIVSGFRPKRRFADSYLPLTTGISARVLLTAKGGRTTCQTEHSCLSPSLSLWPLYSAGASSAGATSRLPSNPRPNNRRRKLRLNSLPRQRLPKAGRPPATRAFLALQAGEIGQC